MDSKRQKREGRFRKNARRPEGKRQRWKRTVDAVRAKEIEGLNYTGWWRTCYGSRAYLKNKVKKSVITVTGYTVYKELEKSNGRSEETSQRADMVNQVRDGADNRRGWERWKVFHRYLAVRIKRPGKELVKSRPGKRKNWGWLSNFWLDWGNVTLAMYWDGEHHWKKWQFEREHHATSVEVPSFKFMIHSHGRAQQAGRWMRLICQLKLWHWVRLPQETVQQIQPRKCQQKWERLRK